MQSPGGAKDRHPGAHLQRWLREGRRWRLGGKRRSWRAGGSSQSLLLSRGQQKLSKSLRGFVCLLPPGSRKNWFSLDDQSFWRRRRERNPEGGDRWGLPHLVQTGELLTPRVLPRVLSSSVGGHQILFADVIVSQPRGPLGGAEVSLRCVTKRVYASSSKKSKAWVALSTISLDVWFYESVCL